MLRHGLFLALACAATLAATPLRAQALPSDEPEASALEPVAVDATGQPVIDWSLLDSPVGTTAATTSRERRASRSDSGATAWTSRENANGSSALSVKQSLTPFWDTQVGADMTVARPSTATAPLPEALAADGTRSGGSAFVAMTAPGVASFWDKTAIEARLDPTETQSRLGTSLSKSLPLGSGDTALTLQNAATVVQQGAAPVAGVAHGKRNLEMDQSARLTMADTGTSLIAGQSLSSADDKWLRKVGAEQKLGAGVSISASVSDTAQGGANRSVTAAFKHSW
jgi:hypothetical protein